MEEKDMSRALQHRTGVVPQVTVGESVDIYLKSSRIRIRKDFRAAIISIMNAAPSSNDSRAGLYASDIVDEVLGALLEFTDCDMVVECILKNADLTTDLHERMTRGI